MNYRHSFHAGNFADVIKHVVLSRIVDYLKRKDKAFRVIDTHAGPGMYNLAGSDASRTGEWRDGIGRIENATFEPAVVELLAPYLEAVAAAQQAGKTLYPGSPWIARHLLRKQDRLSVTELHPQDAGALRRLFAGDFQVRVNELDGWLALGAHLPPKEKRGLALVDPPFELEGEFDRLIDGAVKVHRRWAGGIQALWYPIKDHHAVLRFRDDLVGTGIDKILDIRLLLRSRSATPQLDGCGMIVINPPFALEEEMRILLPALLKVLRLDDGATADAVWLARSA